MSQTNFINKNKKSASTHIFRIPEGINVSQSNLLKIQEFEKNMSNKFHKSP